MRRALTIAILALAAASFVAPSAALPALQRAWRASPESLGLVLCSGILGAGAAALVAGTISGIGAPRALGLAAAGLTASGLAFVAAPSAEIAAIAAFGIGASAGLLDSAAARWEAGTTGGSEALSRLAFVLGTVAGPVAVAWLVHTPLGWRGPFVALAVVAGGLGAYAGRHRPPGPPTPYPGDVDASGAPLSVSAVAMMACAASSVGAPLVFSSWLVYDLVAGKGVAWLPASLALALFWAALAAGRVACPWVTAHAPPPTLLWTSTLAASAAYGSLPFLLDRGWLFVAISLAGLASSSQFSLLAIWLGSSWSADSAHVSVLLAAAADVWAAAGVYGLGALAARSPTLGMAILGRGPLRVQGLDLGILALAGALLLAALSFRTLARRNARASRRDPAGEDAHAGGGVAAV